MLAPDWLRGSVGFELTDGNVSFVLDNRGVLETADSSAMSQKQKDLTRADAYTIFLTSSNKGTSKRQDGNSSETTAGESFTYRQEAQRLAIYYYELWGETIPDTLSNTIVNKSDLW